MKLQAVPSRLRRPFFGRWQDTLSALAETMPELPHLVVAGGAPLASLRRSAGILRPLILRPRIICLMVSRSVDRPILVESVTSLSHVMVRAGFPRAPIRLITLSLCIRQCREGRNIPNHFFRRLRAPTRAA